MKKKNAFKSKTVWFSLLITVLMQVPGVEVWLMQHYWLVAIANVLLRFFTKDELSIPVMRKKQS